MSTQAQHLEIVKKLIDSKAVDFEAIGKVFAEVGPQLALNADRLDGDGFCGTMRHYIRLYLFNPGDGGVENLGGLHGSTSELQA